MRLSVVVPLYNEEENVASLVESVCEALAAEAEWELILVDDGSHDDTARVARERAGADARVVVVELARNYGQTQAMQAGFDQARGDVVVSMDGDLQNDPRDIPLLVATLEEGYDLVAGYRQRRQDRVLTRRLPSWVANRLIARLTGVPVRDNGCTLKAYRRSVLTQLDLYSDMHRFLPALAAATTAARITEVSVRHHPRRFGVSKYGLTRVGKLLADLVTLKMISSFRERPLTLFAIASMVPLLAAALVGGAWTYGVLEGWGWRHEGVYVLPGAALILLAFAVHLVMLGLLAEQTLSASRRSEAAAPRGPLGGTAPCDR